jgi:hypothetical protein
MIAAQLWRAKRAKITAVHQWRPRRECFGELVQWDTSEHDWLERRGPKLHLVAMIDDATSIGRDQRRRSDEWAESGRFQGVLERTNGLLFPVRCSGHGP